MTEKADIERLRGLVNENLFREAPRADRIDVRESLVRWVKPDESNTDPVLRAWISELLHG